MSDVVAVALISALVPAFVSIAIFSVAKYSEFQSMKENNREWYKRTLFEKRLASLQEAWWWLAQLRDASSQDPEFTDDSGLLLLNRVERARTWYSQNVIYLHGGVPEECPVAALLLSIDWHAKGYGEAPDSALWQRSSDMVKQKALDLLQPLTDEKDRVIAPRAFTRKDHTKGGTA